MQTCLLPALFLAMHYWLRKQNLHVEYLLESAVYLLLPVQLELFQQLVQFLYCFRILLNCQSHLNQNFLIHDLNFQDLFLHYPVFPVLQVFQEYRCSISGTPLSDFQIPLAYNLQEQLLIQNKNILSEDSHTFSNKKIVE